MSNDTVAIFRGHCVRSKFFRALEIVKLSGLWQKVDHYITDFFLFMSRVM